VEIIRTFFDFVIHLDKYLNLIVANHGLWAYTIFFFIIFAETGLVITPFFPGDSFLFALGTFAAVDSLNIFWLFIILSTAAILGDSTNYAIGKNIGSRFLEKNKVRFIKEAHIKKTQRFYEKYGPKTIVIARFVPIVRTFAPFVAGIGKMSYRRFFIYNILGGILWIAVFLFGGFYFGNFKLVKENFGSVILLIVILSILPGIIEFFKSSLKKR
jgi:membrane-associated protein